MTSADFSPDITALSKTMQPDQTFTADALDEMNKLANIIVEKVMKAVNIIIASSKAKTVTSRDIQSAVRLVFQGELAKHAVSEGTKYVTRWNARASLSGDKAADKAMKAEKPTADKLKLVFNIQTVDELIVALSHQDRKGSTAGIYLTGVLEYLIAELIELAGRASKEDADSDQMMTQRHVKLAIINDEELNKLFADVFLAGGVRPDIHQYLMTAKSPSKKAKKTKSPGAPKKPKA